MSVKVAVRVRPFNSRELELKSKLCIQMKGQTTTLTSPSGSPREFTFDYSFWSHDCFSIDEQGRYLSATEKYADQQKVFNAVGEEILKNAIEGYHCCLFAYGQTGSGKSYSMVGYPPNKGIVPIVCEELFKRMKTGGENEVKYQVNFSMLEIYNEKVQDLLIPIGKRTQGGLKIREHKVHGVFVQDLSKHQVSSYSMIESLTEIGNRNRTIGSTMMNACSSRAHTIVSIEFRQLEEINNKKIEKLSIIHLVDLAGSEKLSKTGAVGDRMKEGCSINKSLTVLGIVIGSLAEKAVGKAKNSVTPYRDSVLTRILQNALGGNSKTLMICALSPSDNNYDETLSTLRYADQAKKIKLNARINENDQDKVIRELKLENERLRQLLFNLESSKLKDENYLEKIKEMEEQLQDNSLFIQEYNFEDSPEVSMINEMKNESKIDLNSPHLININEDPILTGKLFYSLKQPVTHIGKKTGNPPPLIILGSLGVKPNHAIIYNEEGRIFLEPYDNECSETSFINGDNVTSKSELMHLDRIIFGGTSCFLVIIPNSQEKERQLNVNEIDWEYVQKEFMNKSDFQKKKQDENLAAQKEIEFKEKMKIIEQKYIKEREDIEMIIKKQKLEYDERVRQLEEHVEQESEAQSVEFEKEQAEKEWQEMVAKMEAQRFQREYEREMLYKELKREEDFQNYQREEKQYLENKLSKYVGKLIEANLIAKEISRKITLQIILDYMYVDSIMYKTANHKNKIQVQVIDYDNKFIHIWPLSKFRNRYFFIKEIFDRFLELGKAPSLTNDEDPFWDPANPFCFGKSFVKLNNLAYLIDSPMEVNILGNNANLGMLKINIIPTDEKATRNLAESILNEDELIDDPGDLVGRRLDFLVKIESANFKEDFFKDCYVEYEIFDRNMNLCKFQTNIIYGKKKNMKFNYIQHHLFKNVEEKVIQYLLNGMICFRLFGFDEKLFTAESGAINTNKIWINTESSDPSNQSLEN